MTEHREGGGREGEGGGEEAGGRREGGRKGRRVLEVVVLPVAQFMH